ncbi:MAG: glycosyltransferase [Ignavibacteriaceae bacterium]|nr:glycosyltransferase [Ignavibacteriaceae bacterium]
MLDNIPITVLITVYNCSNYIKSSITSILNQSYKNYELLIIDDGSEDDIDGIIKSINNDKIRFLRQKHKGRSAALNYGLNVAKYDWVALMDADDIAVPERLEKEVKLINIKDNDIIFSDSAYFRNKKIKFLNVINTDKEDLIRKIEFRGHICNSSVLYNRNYILANGGYNENLNHSEDFELWLRLLHKANFIHLNEILIFMRIRDHSLSTKAAEGSIKKVSVFSGINEPMSEKSLGLLNSFREYFYRRKIKLKVKYFLWKIWHYNKHLILTKKLEYLDRIRLVS